MLSKMNLTLCLIVLWLLPTGLSSDYYSNPLGKQSTAPAAQSIAGSWAIRSSTPGLVWTSRKYVDSSYGNQVVNVLDIDLTLVKLRSVRTQYSNKYESILSMGNRTKALAGVNGGFFCYTTDDICSTTACSSPTNCPPPVQPRSLLIISGTTKSANCALRTSFGLTGTGVPKIQQVGAGQSWPGVSYAVGAGPNLVTGGTKNITQEGFCWYTESAPRTAVATTSNGHILLVTVDGRYKGADGMTIDMLADFLINEFKVTSAMNLDGGGSTSMYYGGKIVNSPSDKTCDGCCRCVYDGLFVYAQ